MKKKWWIIGSLTIMVFALASWQGSPQHPDYTLDSKVNNVLFTLGEPKPEWYPEDVSDAAVERGRSLIFEGRAVSPEGNKSKYISVYYMCTNCHNTAIEDPVLTVSEPQARLEYANEHGLPFFQGTTFYGITNRESWYNDDYFKKYGDLVKATQHDLREAIQLCARECSQGRPLDNWEVESIMAYYVTIGYTLADIGFTEADVQKLNTMKGTESELASAKDKIKSRYLHKSPATFVEPPYDSYWETLRDKGNPENGKLVYELSCQSCHISYGVSDVVFGDSKQDFKLMSRWFDKNDWWLFQIVRHGTHPGAGHKEYMPHYTKERMSDQQVEDLRAYILIRAAKSS